MESKVKVKPLYIWPNPFVKSNLLERKMGKPISKHIVQTDKLSNRSSFGT